MEILAEIALQIAGWFLEFLGELALQAVGELVAEFIGHSLKEPFRRPRPLNPWLAATGYLLFSTLAGAVSLWILPSLFIAARWLRIANLFLTPIAAGILMAYLVRFFWGQ